MTNAATKMLALAGLLSVSVGSLADGTEVNVENFVRTESDTMLRANLAAFDRRLLFPIWGDDISQMQVVNQDHYMFVEAKPGTYDLSEENAGTRFALVTIRPFADPNDSLDLEKAHDAQDAIKVEGGRSGPFDAPEWDQESLAVGRKALNAFAAALGFEASKAFGRKDEIQPTSYLIGAAAGWRGLPQSAAM